MNTIKRFSLTILAVLSMGLVACGGGNQPEPEVKATGISLNKNEISLLAEETFQLEATVSPADKQFEITWSSSDSNIATVSSTGLVYAVSAGTVDVVATVKNTPTVSEKCSVTVAAAFHDYVKDGSVKLKLDYKGHKFYTDGVEQVSLLTPIDGDTAHFTPKSGGDTIKSRFYGIDTPESTGKVQPWGVEASDFTKQKLKNAEKNGTIVVSSPNLTYAKPNPDSTGSRYVSLIWINEEKKDAPYDELYLLNLWIVQEGYSMVRNVSDIPDYEDSFNDSYRQAVVYKLNMWSGKPAPGYNYDTGYKDVSLLDIRHEVEKSIADSTYKNAYDNEKVRFTGVVSSYKDGILYIQEFYPTLDEDGNEQYDANKNIIGEWAGINIFCGMSEIPGKFTATNTYLQVYGLCKDSETFGFQITDTQGKWKAYGAGEEDCKVLLKAEENTEEHSLYTFEYTAEELNAVAKANNCESLFCSVKVNDVVECSRAYIAETSRDITLYFKYNGNDTAWNIYIPYAYHGDPQNKVDRWDEEKDFVGRKFRLDLGTYAWHRTQSGKVVYQIIPTLETYLVWVQEETQQTTLF